MKLWMSGEVQGDIEKYHMVRNDVEEAVNKSLEKLELTDVAKEWNVIPIILSDPFSAGFDEIAKRKSKGYALEFRLRLPHSEFKICSNEYHTHISWRGLEKPQSGWQTPAACAFTANAHDGWWLLGASRFTDCRGRSRNQTVFSDDSTRACNDCKKRNEGHLGYPTPIT